MGTPLQRRVGLSRRQPPSSLLSTFRNTGASQDPLPDTKTSAQPARTRTSTKTETEKMAPRTGASKPDRPVADDAPPLPTDDEDGNSGDQASQGSSAPSHDEILDSSEDELANRGDIKATQFRGARNGRQARPGTGRQVDQGKHTRNSLKGTRSTSSRKKRKVSIEQDEKDEKEESSSSHSQAGSPDKNQTVDTVDIFPKRRIVRNTYKPRKKGFEAPSKHEIDSMDDSDPGSPVKLKPVPAANISPVKAAKFIPVGDNPLSSPQAPGAKQVRLRMPALSDINDEDFSPAKKPKAKAEPRIRVPRGRLGMAGPNSKKASKSKKTDDAAEESGLEDSFSSSLPAKKFVAPASFSQLEAPSTSVLEPGDSDDDDDDDDNSSLSEVGSDICDASTQARLDQDASLLAEAARKITTTTLCPWCQAPVEKSLLEGFAKGKRLNVRMQARFCQSHKKQTALATWRERRYPKVDWERLEARFAAHRGRLLGIINGGESHYRAKLAGRIELGQARDMKKEENLNPGYYGPRGFNVMCDYMVGEFGDLLKEKAVGDRVIAGRGSAAFIQSVLVAELAVQLIREDLGVSAESAREILEESKALGDMVHEEV